MSWLAGYLYRKQINLYGSSGMAASSGGSVTTSGSYTIRTFTANDTLVVTTPGLVKVLIVAGGGSGGNGQAGVYFGGGGGGGAVIEGIMYLAAGSYPVVVGAGGLAQATLRTVGNNGQNSSFNGATALGGGGGSGGNGGSGLNGGSGGGGCNSGVTAGLAVPNAYKGVIQYGYAGGTGVGNATGAGGGGAGGVGAAGGTGTGGIGRNSTITGAVAAYAAGGAGSGGASGAANTGNGGAGYVPPGSSGAGGSGIVIISYFTTPGTQTNYPKQLNVQKKISNLFLNTPFAEPESMVYGVMNDFLYWGSDWANTNIGHVYKTDLSTGVTTVIKVGSQLASWQGLVAGATVWTVGEEKVGHLQCVLQHITPDSIDTVYRSDTGDCNELIGIETDGTNIIGGERYGGGDATGSSYPNGGGIWKIPIATYNTPATWVREYETSNHYGWNSIVYLGTTHYGALQAAGNFGRWQIVHSTDLVHWSTDLDYSAQNAGGGYQVRMAKAGSKLVAIGPVAATGHYEMFVFDGVSWTTYDLGIAYGAALGVMYWDSDLNKVVFCIDNAYSVNIDGTGLTTLVTGINQSNQAYSQHYSCTKYDKTVYIPAIYITATSSGLVAQALQSSAVYNNVYLAGKCKDDFSDAHFTKSDQITEIPYWLESVTSGVIESVFVNCDSIPATPSSGAPYLYYGNAGASSASSFVNTFTKGDDFEWGINGNNLNVSGGSVTWTTTLGAGSVAAITTVQQWGGTRSALLTVSTVPDQATFPFTGAAGVAPYAIAWRIRKDASNEIYITHGNGSKRAMTVYRATTNKVDYFTAGVRVDTGSTITSDVWYIGEIRNIDFTLGTFDMYLNGSLIQSCAFTQNDAGEANIFNMQTIGGSSSWMDNVIIRNYANPEPTWGTWGAEEQSNTPAIKDVATRFFLVLPTGYKDVATRFPLAIRGYQDIATRFLLKINLPEHGVGLLGGALLVVSPNKWSQIQIDQDKDWAGMGITDIKELADNMAQGDTFYFDGTKLTKITPGSIGTILTTHDVGAIPTFEYPP